MDRLRNTVSWVQKDKTKNYLVLTIFLRQEAPEVEDDEEEHERSAQNTSRASGEANRVSAVKYVFCPIMFRFYILTHKSSVVDNLGEI